MRYSYGSGRYDAWWTNPDLFMGNVGNKATVDTDTITISADKKTATITLGTPRGYTSTLIFIGI